MPDSGKVNEETAKARQLMADTSRRQADLAAQFQAEHKALRQSLRMKEGAAVRDGFLQKIRRWYIDYRDLNGKFPDLPPDDEGGSKVIYETPSVAPAEPVAAAVSSALSGAAKKVKRFSFRNDARH